MPIIGISADIVFDNPKLNYYTILIISIYIIYLFFVLIEVRYYDTISLVDNSYWMSKLDDNTQLSELYIPGSTKDQTCSTEILITNGIRALPYNKNNLEITKKYLKIYPSEFIILYTSNIHNVQQQIINNSTLIVNDITEDIIVQDIRGKIIIIPISSIYKIFYSTFSFSSKKRAQITKYTFEEEESVLLYGIILISLCQYKNWYCVNKIINKNITITNNNIYF